MTAPLYRHHKAPEKFSNEGNAGLWFERFFNAYDKDFTEVAGAEQKKEWMKVLNCLVGNQAELSRYAESQWALVNTLNGEARVYACDWRLVTGNPHPVENGLSWHPVLGVPYISGAAVKGLVRAWLEEWHYGGDAQDAKKVRLRQWFGSDHKDSGERREDVIAGGLIFFDAVPIQPVKLITDIMTPHMGKWYEQGGKIEDVNNSPERVPADWHSPTPIPFLVAEAPQLLFGIAPRNGLSARRVNMEEVMGCLGNALQWLGAGAKTAVGYGRMSVNDGKTNDLKGTLETRRREEQRHNMTQEQRIIDELAVQLESDKAKNIKNPSGPLAEKLNAWVKAGVRWQAEDRLWLADVAVNFYDYVGWGKPAKKKQREELIQKLRDGQVGVR